MIRGLNPIVQAALGTLFTWGVTALGSGLVFFFDSGQRILLDWSLGFAAGVMTAASYWSLLAPAIEMAELSETYGKDGEYAFIPVSIGFGLGAFFVYGADRIMPSLGIINPVSSLALSTGEKYNKEPEDYSNDIEEQVSDSGQTKDVELRLRNQQLAKGSSTDKEKHVYIGGSDSVTETQRVSWRRISLLVLAITIHNIPEGLAVGVGFGAIGKSKAASFESARNLAIGIGLQNFPEGMAVSVPLKASGFSTLKAFWYGQLSGMVEPIAGIFGALAVSLSEPILPYALAFAAGAMIYVVVDDIIPEGNACGNGKYTSWGAIAGFIVMMAMDVGLG